MVMLSGGIFQERERTYPTPAQFRAARALLDWSLVDMARAAKVPIAGVLMVEGGRAASRQTAVAAAMRVALEAEGIRFLAEANTGIGVSIRPCV